MRSPEVEGEEAKRMREDSPMTDISEKLMSKAKEGMVNKMVSKKVKKTTQKLQLSSSFFTRFSFDQTLRVSRAR